MHVCHAIKKQITTDRLIVLTSLPDKVIIIIIYIFCRRQSTNKPILLTVNLKGLNAV